MDNEKEKLEHFISAVMKKADMRAADVIKEAQEKRDEIIASAKAAAEEAGKRHIKDSEKMSAGRFTREVAKAEQDMKRELYEYREKLTGEMFDSLRSRISEYVLTDAYRDALVKGILSEDRTNAELYVCERDRAYAEAAVKDTAVRTDENIVLGGYILMCPDRGLCIDKTFDSALEEQRERFASRNIYENGVES